MNLHRKFTWTIFVMFFFLEKRVRRDGTDNDVMFV